jgi:hypothetical protein
LYAFPQLLLWWRADPRQLGDTNKERVYGEIVHRVFQDALVENRFDQERLKRLLASSVQEALPSLYLLPSIVNMASDTTHTPLR